MSISTPKHAIAVFRLAAQTLEECSRIDYIALFNRFIDFMKSMNADRTLNRMLDERKLSPGYSHSYAANLALLHESVNSEIEAGRLSLTYKSLFDTSRVKINWFPLMQAFYDLNDQKNGIDRPDGHEVPEHVLIKGLFQLIWNGSIDYHEDLDYPSEAEVISYINANTRCPISKDFMVNPSHFRVPENIQVTKDYHPRVYLFAPDYSAIEYGGKPTIYKPSNVIDGRLNRRYHREVGSPPPIEMVRGKIVQKFEDVGDLTSLRTLRQNIIPRVEVQLDDGRKFTYHICELYLDGQQPPPPPKGIFKFAPSDGTRSRSRSRGRKDSDAPPPYSDARGRANPDRTRGHSRASSRASSPNTRSPGQRGLEQFGFLPPRPGSPRGSKSPGRRGGKRITKKNIKNKNKKH